MRSQSAHLIRCISLVNVVGLLANIFCVWAAEYDIIPHMNAMCTSTVVDYMYVEWHDGFKSITKKAKERAQAAKAAMEAAGTQFPQYDSPA